MLTECNPTMNKLEIFLRERYIFLKNSITHPLQTGALIPSTKAGIEEIIRGIDFKKDQVIFDVGSGTGAVADKLYQRKSPGSKVVCLEIDKKFCCYLEQKFEKPVKKGDLVIVNGDAANIVNYASEYVLAWQKKTIVSCLPLMTIDPETRNTIVQEIYLSLAPGEMFKQIQYCFKTWEKRFRQMYGSVEVIKVPLRWMPLFMFDTYVYTCVKQT